MIKWIGQHIWDFISRFRNDVYLEDLSDPGSDTDKFLVVDANDKVGYRTGAEVLSDIGGSGGGATTFTLTADSGSDQTIADGNTLDIAGGGAISTVVSATDTVTINHDDTSSQSSVDNSGRTYIQDVTLDAYGHVTGLTSATETVTDTTYSEATSSSEGLMSTAHHDKLDGIEDNADVTDTANVTAAGALMDSEVDADIKTLSLPANTTISTFGASLVDDADAAAARTTLGVDASGTDNSTNVTLAGSLDYITISGQELTRNAIDLAADVTGVLPHANIGGDAIDGDNIADDSINSEHYVDGSIDTAHIGDDQVTYAKIQNVSATDRILGRDSAGAGVIEEITPANLRTMINVEDGATADQTQSDINGLAITTVGALNSGSITSGFGNIDTGSSTIDTTGAVSTGEITSTSIRHSISGNSNGDYGPGAEIIYNIGSTNVTAGVIYALKDSSSGAEWVQVDADIEASVHGLLAVATAAADTANNSSAGMIIKGCVTLASTYTAGSDDLGAIVYASQTGGEATLTKPTAADKFVRILGYSLNASSKKMFFNPDSTYIKLS
tara:strand:+ start:10 stop:1683 length:1674 start_codon:yes stop_codon:yes gene_type:complete